MKYLNHTALVVASLIMFNCGGKEEKKPFSYETTPETKTETTTETHSTASTTTEDGVVEVMLHSDDKMTYDLKEIKVKKGHKVKLTLMHIGKMPKNVMGHNFVLLKQGVVMSTFATAAASAGETDYIPVDTQDVIAHTNLLGGGESDVIEFDAPEVGVYDFLCSFPGHYALMKGKFIVE